MGKARVYGKNTKITFLGFDVGEIDKFSAKKTDSVTLSRPIGTALQSPNLVNGGWDLTIDGGKINSNFSNLINIQEVINLIGGYTPHFDIIHTVKFYDGSTETCVYKDSVIFGFDFTVDGAMNEIKESSKGFAPYRVKTPDTNFNDLKDVGEKLAFIVAELLLDNAS